MVSNLHPGPMATNGSKPLCGGLLICSLAAQIETVLPFATFLFALGLAPYVDHRLGMREIHIKRIDRLDNDRTIVQATVCLFG